MMRARTATVLAGSAILVLSLAGCDKPNPGASVFSGTTSQFQRASCWSFTGEAIDPAACAKDVVGSALEGARIPKIPVVPGQVIGISVDPVVADEGWVPQVNSQNLTQSPITSTYFRFTYPEFQSVPEEGILLQIVAGKEGASRGVWFYRLMPS
ncbi:MAG: hypothetical protein IPO93_01965 [Actinobacteria bacterium]|jgi:hypothetical protein|nr:hypothetical protein [Actinomycetota bacterium]